MAPRAYGKELCLSLLKLGTRSMALRRLLALAAAATVAADVVQVAVLCNYIEARIADRQDCDAIIAAVDAINDKKDGVLDDVLQSRGPSKSRQDLRGYQDCVPV